MMRVKFTLFERVAGLFVVGAIVGLTGFSVAVAISRGWFEARKKVSTALETADGVREGTSVMMQGLRIGKVQSVRLISAREVVVEFDIGRTYWDKVRKDSVVRVTRPFIIGDKVLDVQVGTESGAMVDSGDVLPSEPSFDIMDMISGRSLSNYMQTFNKVSDNLKYVAEALLDPERTRAFIQMVDSMNPLLQNANTLTTQTNILLKKINKGDRLIVALDQLNVLSHEVNKLLPMVAKDSPDMVHDLSKIAHNMAILTDELQAAMPVVHEMAPEFPRVSRRAIEALDETVVVLKALQKSFILRGSAREVREEERAPAGGAEKTR